MSSMASLHRLSVIEHHINPHLLSEKVAIITGSGQGIGVLHDGMEGSCSVLWGPWRSLLSSWAGAGLTQLQRWSVGMGSPEIQITMSATGA